MKFYLDYTCIYVLILILTIIVSKKFHFYDIPNYRKIHKKKILNTSGLSMYIFLLLVIYLNELSAQLEEVMSLGIVITLVGFIDDRVSINARTKLIFILIPVIYLIINGYRLDDLGTYQFLGKLNLGKFNFVFTLLAVGLVVNSYNYIDGIDGLLLSIIITSLIYVIFLIDNSKNVTILILLMCIPLTLNLIVNFLPTKNLWKIFLGNCGSLFLGFFMSFLMIFLYKYQKVHPAYIIWIVFYPVADFIFVSFYRIFKKKKFYIADKMHLHHKMLSTLNNSHVKTTFIITFFHVLLLANGYWVTKNFGSFYSLLLFLLLNIKFFFIRFYFEYRGVEQSGSSSGS